MERVVFSAERPTGRSTKLYKSARRGDNANGTLIPTKPYKIQGVCDIFEMQRAIHNRYTTSGH
jgi:hypothetical protein